MSKSTKKIRTLLWLEAILAAGFAVLAVNVFQLESSIAMIYLPFQWIGKGMRMLSLGSGIGNVVAILLYLTLAFLPVVIRCWKGKTQQITYADSLLVILSGYGFYFWYQFINPALMQRRMSQSTMKSGGIQILELMLVEIYLGLVFTYLVLFALEKQKKNWMNSLRQILVAVALLITAFLAYVKVFELLQQFQSVSTSYSVENMIWNSIEGTMGGFPQASQLELLSIIIGFLCVLIPYLFVIGMIIAGYEVLVVMEENQFGKEFVNGLERLARISKDTVIISVVSELSYNVFQFAVLTKLNNVNINVNLSMMPLIFAFVTTILTQYAKKSSEVKEENEEFI